MEVCGPLRPQTNTGKTTQSCAGSVFHIDFSYMPVAPEVLLAIRDLLHPFPAYSLALCLGFAGSAGPLVGGIGHRRRGGRREPMAMMMSSAGSLSSVIYQPLSSLPTTHPCFFLKKGKERVFQNLTFGMQRPSAQCKCKCKH